MRTQLWNLGINASGWTNITAEATIVQFLAPTIPSL
jgi:hypothetical protein